MQKQDARSMTSIVFLCLFILSKRRSHTRHGSFIIDIYFETVGVMDIQIFDLKQRYNAHALKRRLWKNACKIRIKIEIFWIFSNNVLCQLLPYCDVCVVIGCDGSATSPIRLSWESLKSTENKESYWESILGTPLWNTGKENKYSGKM